MTKTLSFGKIIFLLFSLIFLLYLALPAPSFPKPLPDSVQSLEEADVEIPTKRAYFTNFDREDVMDYYTGLFPATLGLPLPTYRLIHPPEEAFTLIRDQTRSTFLEEITHPSRESFFVNGFKPRFAKDEIWYKGMHYEQKITVKYVSSSVVLRLAVGVATLALLALLLKQTKRAVLEFFA